MAPPKLLKVDRDKLKKLAEQCQQEESKGLPLQEVLEELSSGINALIQKGFTYEEIAAYFAKNDVHLSVSAIKDFVQAENSKANSKAKKEPEKGSTTPKKTRRPSKPKAEKEGSSDQKRPAGGLTEHSIAMSDAPESKELDPTAGLGAASNQTEEERSDRYSSPPSRFNLVDPKDL